MRRPFLVICTALAGLAMLAPAADANVPEKPRHTHVGLQRVAAFQHQVTGVGISAQGRILVNFPRVVGRNGAADGLWSDARGIWVSSPEDYAFKLRTGAQIGTVLRDRRLDWPDTFSQGPDGTIYVTASRIPDMQWSKPRNPPQLTTSLWALTGTAR